MVVVLTAHHPVGIVSYGIPEQGSQAAFRGEAAIRNGSRRQCQRFFSSTYPSSNIISIGHDEKAELKM